MKTTLKEAYVISYLKYLIKHTNHSKKRDKLIKELNQILEWAK